MDKRFNSFGRIQAKKVWYIDGKSFMSDKGTQNGKAKAHAYALEHMLDINDILKFDSEMEYKRYCFLKEQERNGNISKLKFHYVFRLLPKFETGSGVEHEELLYEADYFYHDERTQKFVVEDVKGLLEDTFRVKWKLFDYIYRTKGLSIVCVRLSGGKYVDFMDEHNWHYICENEKPKKRVVSLREENRALRREKELNDIKYRKEQKERSRLLELRKKRDCGICLSKQQRERLENLENKFKV